MPKTDMKTIAVIAEVIASIAVIVSLAFVVVSVNQNTAALRSVNDNFLYEIADARIADLQNDPELARLLLQRQSGEPLDPIAEMRVDYWVLRAMNAWELAFTRHAEGLMPPSQWEAWNVSFIDVATSNLPFETWDSYKVGYGEAFRAHVDAAYAAQ